MDAVFRKDALTRAIEAIAAAGGSEPREARLVADNLVEANLLGHDSHGIGMMPRYVESLLSGGLKPNRRVEVCLDAGALLALDGGTGYGQSLGVEAMQLGIARAREHGVSVTTLANAHHLGRIGHWAEMALAEGLVAMHFANVLSYARVAPYGGAQGRFGTNPCCIGIPLPGEPPFLLDMATSAVAQGKLRVAHNKRQKVAPGLLIDDHGNPSDDPRWGVVQPFGAMLTFGAHKGYGLAVACELLGGALTGGGTMQGPKSSRSGALNGMLTILFDARRLGTEAQFAREAHAYLEWLRSSPPAPGFDRVRLAGEPEREMRTRRERDGIPVDEETWKEILAAAAKLNLAPERIEALAAGRS